MNLARRLLRQEADALPLLPFTGGLRERWLRYSEGDYRVPHLGAYQSLTRAAISLAGNPSLGLAFVHLPVPHPPYIYDRQRGAIDITAQREYLDNLSLTDRTLGELRQAMEKAGTWDSTTILISSDHWWRTDYWESVQLDNFWSAKDTQSVADANDHRVPFLLKLAGEKTAGTYVAPFNTVLSHDLILEIMGGRITNSGQVTMWLDAHRTIGESPYRDYNDPQ
jgi:hypothetical protein